MAASRSEAVAVLSVSPLEEDHLSLGLILGQAQGRLHQARSCEEALRILRQSPLPVVLCERNLPDGDWKLLLHATQPLDHAPLVIVCSRAADESLWAEVLNLGGWDVLAKPFEAREVMWSVSLAWGEWLRRVPAPTEDSLTAER